MLGARAPSWQAAPPAQPSRRSSRRGDRRGADTQGHSSQQGSRCRAARQTAPSTHVGALELPVHDAAHGQRAGAVRALVQHAGGAARLVPKQHPGLAKQVKGDHVVLQKCNREGGGGFVCGCARKIRLGGQGPGSSRAACRRPRAARPSAKAWGAAAGSAARQAVLAPQLAGRQAGSASASRTLPSLETKATANQWFFSSSSISRLRAVQDNGSGVRRQHVSGTRKACKALSFPAS